MRTRAVDTFDTIIVGAGSAGCILANRLSEDSSRQVLLIEAGGSDRSILIRMPTALSYPMRSRRYNWGYETEPEPGLDGRRLQCPRGKVLGGTSSINGMVYVRGHACDFDEWEASGAIGWGYRHCLPYFRKVESWAGGADAYRGGDGPIATCNGSGMRTSPLYRAFIDAGIDAGYAQTQDYNGHQQEGFGAMHMTVGGGARASTATAYLRPARTRPNLKVITRAHVARVTLRGDRATGVIWRRKGRETQSCARNEVILAAGAVGTPALLQLSGIGPEPALKRAGVPVRHVLPGVGENLQDHLEVYFQFYCKQPVTLNNRLGTLSKALIGARWLLFRDGLGSSNHFESCAFIRSRAGIEWPDIQYHFLPAAMRYDGNARIRGHGFQVHVGPTKSKSTGCVRIASDDPSAHPRIRFNYLTAPEDLLNWRDCIRLTREIFAQPAMDAFRGEEIQPGRSVVSNAAIDAWVRNNVESAYHASCTCKMGAADDPLAVVDASCRVRGLRGLRVVDSSVFPTITNGNLNAPTMMLAEKAADLILGRKPLPASDATAWIDSQWRTRQRPGQPQRASQPKPVMPC